MRLVERRHTLVAIEVRYIRDPVVIAADDIGPGERGIVLAPRQRVGRLGLPPVGHPLRHRRGERVIRGLADRLEHVDVIEGGIHTGRGADLRRIDRPSIR